MILDKFKQPIKIGDIVLVEDDGWTMGEVIRLTLEGMVHIRHTDYSVREMPQDIVVFNAQLEVIKKLYPEDFI